MWVQILSQIIEGRNGTFWKRRLLMGSEEGEKVFSAWGKEKENLTNLEPNLPTAYMDGMIVALNLTLTPFSLTRDVTEQVPYFSS